MTSYTLGTASSDAAVIRSNGGKFFEAAAGAQLTIYDAPTGRNLLGTVTTDVDGQYALTLPDGKPGVGWVDTGDGGPRVRVYDPQWVADLASQAQTSAASVNPGVPNGVATLDASSKLVQHVPAANVDNPPWVASSALVMESTASLGARSVGLISNQTDPDAAYYILQQYSSALADGGVLYGYASNVKRTGSGTRRVVGAQLNGYGLDVAAAGSNASVWGIATEAWSGDSTTEAQRSFDMIGAELAVISQYHANAANPIGADLTFKNRSDNATEVLHGSAGSNQFNKNSKALQISSQARTASDAFCGWNTGIYFKPNSLDQSVDGLAVGIDISAVDTTRVGFAMKLPTGLPIALGSRSATNLDGIRYKNDGTGPRIEFVRDLGLAGESVRATIPLDVNSAAGTVMAYSATATTVGAAGGASALPATPLGYFTTRLATGTTVKIPYYSN